MAAVSNDGHLGPVTAKNDEAVVELEGAIGQKEGDSGESKEALAVHDPNVITFRNLDPPVTPEEERRVRRKIDMRLPPFLCLVYISTWLDRGNLGNAALMGIEANIGLTGSKYSLAVSLFFVGTCLGDLGTNIGMRFIRPSYWLSGAMITWGAIATLMAAVSNPAGMYALRLILGLFESAFISGAPYLVTFWYPRAEWGRRMSVYLAATPLAGAFGGWIAFGISHIHGAIQTWRILFIIEGGLTVLVAACCFYILPDRPHNTRWLKPREREVAEWRMLRDGNRTHGHFGWADLMKSLIDWRLGVNIVIFMTQNLSNYVLATFTPIIVNSFGYSDVKSQLMVAPPYCVGFVMVFVVGYISDRVGLRAGLFVINCAFALTGMLMLCLLDESHNSARYGALFLIIPAIVSGVTLSIGNVADNCCGDIKKACACGLYQSFGATMGIVTGYLLPTADAPLYRSGFWTLFGVTLLGAFLALFMTFEMRAENSRRDKKYGKPNPDQIYDFSELGEKHPFWRYTP